MISLLILHAAASVVEMLTMCVGTRGMEEEGEEEEEEQMETSSIGLSWESWHRYAGMRRQLLRNTLQVRRGRELDSR